MQRPRHLEYAPNFQALSLFRLCLALYLLVQFAGLLPFYSDFYSDVGILPLSVLAGDRAIAGIDSLLPLLRVAQAAGITIVLPILYPLSLLALAIDYRTRWACAFALVFNSYLFWRNPYLDSGAEILARLLLLWSLFLPLNRYWSVDAALDPAPRRRDYPALPFFALRLQISALYFFSALFKLEGAPWRNGYALSWTLQDDLFGAMPAGSFAVAHFSALLPVVNYLVIGFQLAFPYLIYSPWRNELTRGVAIAGSAAMHLSFVVFLQIGGFPYLCLIMLLLLVPDRWLDHAFAPRRARLARVAIYYEPGCGFCEKVALLLRELLLSPTIAVRPAAADAAALRLLTEHQSWVVYDEHGTPHLKWRAVAYVLRQNPLAAPIGWLTDVPAVRPAMLRCYDAIGAHRRSLGALTRFILPFHSDRLPGRAILALNGALAALALVANVISLDQWSAASPRPEMHTSSADRLRAGIDEFLAVAQIRQAWALFSPVPTHWIWRFDFRGVDVRGARIDLAAALPFVAADTAGHVVFRRALWAKYFSRFDLLTENVWQALGA